MLVNGFKVTSETHSAKGRADLMIESDNRRIIFELKFAHNENEAKEIAAVFNADPVVRAFTQFKTV